MANWKKVAVSGSNISQFNNDAGYLTTVTQQNAFASASFNGTSLIADSSNGNLIFATGSATGLTISANASTDTLTFSLANIPNSSLTNSTISGKALGTNLDSLTAGSGISGSSYNGSGPITFSIIGGDHITVSADGVGVNTSSLLGEITGSLGDSISGSIYSGISGDISISTSGVASIGANSVNLGTDTVGNYVASLGTLTGLSTTGNTGEGSTPTLTVTYGSTANTAVQGNTTFTLNGTTNEIDITGTAAQALGSAPSYTVGLANTIGGNRTFTGDISVQGNFVVEGTASFQNTQNLDVADRFIRLASGSSAAGDGGIVVQQTSPTAGEAFAFENGVSRWGVATEFSAVNSSITLEAFISAVVVGSTALPSEATSRYQAKGNIFVGSDEEIWIYS